MNNVIFADDDPGIQDAFRLMFERAGYQVTIFANGNPLLNNEYEHPDIFILDKQLSGIDGLDICRYLKEHDSTSKIPVIMLSASPLISRLAGIAGADDFMEKPFKMKDLLAMVRKYILRKSDE